ncbi:hypothetical protein CROQUDRAFT_696371 [Cronartium quercuum f. sp. fusiforme G11]|uniref:Uncharacterized protein n=1 Tax=Cronartium quercuum f. sp. fusiforme G11 TaxID=708437 RepID=A0A9P6TCW0_9BASI|nr:hypothetical protein CROQUDRAFT_696371 [Cronartium quercuum f. sp. fusiforme G11]
MSANSNSKPAAATQASAKTKEGEAAMEGTHSVTLTTASGAKEVAVPEAILDPAARASVLPMGVDHPKGSSHEPLQTLCFQPKTPVECQVEVLKDMLETQKGQVQILKE